MTLEAIEDFGHSSRILDLAQNTDPLLIFWMLGTTVAWRDRQDRRPSADLDAMLFGLKDHPFIWTVFLLNAASVDLHYFRLARRMTAHALAQESIPPLTVRRMASVLLINDAPTKAKPMVARDAALVIAIAVVQNLGWRPTENGAGAKNRSGCGRMTKFLWDGFSVAMEYDAIVKVWKDRQARLEAFGLDRSAALDFFEYCSPTTSSAA